LARARTFARDFMPFMIPATLAAARGLISSTDHYLTPPHLCLHLPAFRLDNRPGKRVLYMFSRRLDAAAPRDARMGIRATCRVKTTDETAGDGHWPLNYPRAEPHLQSLLHLRRATRYTPLLRFTGRAPPAALHSHTSGPRWAVLPLRRRAAALYHTPHTGTPALLPLPRPLLPTCYRSRQHILPVLRHLYRRALRRRLLP